MKTIPGPPAPRPMLRPRPLAQRKLKPRVARGLVAPQPVTRQAVAAAAPPPAPAAALPAGNVLRLRGDYWEIGYGGSTAIVEDCRGLRYIALLVQDFAAGRGPVHAKELVARADGAAPMPTELELRDFVLDATARQQLVARLEQIAAERDRACAVEDFERAAALDAEHERIADELTHAAANGGRRRGAAFTDAGEKARKAVGKAISEAIARIASHPELSSLAQHLSSTIRKGQWLSYSGDAGWRVDLKAPLPRK